MNTTMIFMATLILLPALGLVAWASFCMAQAEEDLLAFSALEALHFES